MGAMNLRRRVAGFSLVELMVSVVIGMLAIMFATRIMTDSERSKDGTLGGSDSMQNGMMAMFSISGDAEQAGFGLNDTLLSGCDTILRDRFKFALSGAARSGTTVFPLAAAVIVDGGSGPDQLSLYAGTSTVGSAAVRLVSDYAGGTDLMVDSIPFGFAVDDVIVVAPETGKPCSVAQISGMDDDAALKTISISDANQRYNNGELQEVYDGNTTRIFNLGNGARLGLHTWSVENGVLRLRATDLGNTGENAQSVADNIVSLKAQYGFNKGDFTPEQGTRINQWSSTMIDADGDGVVGSPGDYQRVTALRIAVVARSKNPDRPAAGGACSATTDPVKVFASAQPDEVDPVPVELDLTTANDSVDWQCYRYRTFETIVPLRNASWRPPV